MEAYQKTEIENRVITLIASISSEPLGNIYSESRLKDDLGLDSLDIVELTIMAEKNFKIELDDKVTEDLFHVSDVVACIFDHLNTNGVSD